MSNSNIEFKAMPGQFNVDEAQGIVECFVAGIGNKDSVGDVLISGAFSKSLTRRKPRVVWGHNWNDPIGKVLEIYEVPPGDRRLPQKMLNAGIGGLYARVQFNLNSEKGREAFANVAFFGQEQEWSIGYKTLDAIFDPNIQANVLKEVELYEVSPVLHGANQLTGTISVKSDELALAEEEKGWGMMNPHHMMGQMPMKPNVIVIREEDDDDDKYESEKPIFSEGLAQPIGGSQRQRLEKEIMERTGSQVRLVEATENTAIFQRMMPNGTPMTFRIGYHTPDNYSTFMFGKPELVDGQNKPSQFGGKPSGSRVVVPSQMPMMPMQVKPGYDQDSMTVMPKSDLSGQLEELEDVLMQELDEKVGRTINKRNLSKLKSILENLQDVIASAEKEDLETKGYLIPVELESAFQTKSILDPIFDYHRVESIVTEDGILITSGVTKDLVEAIDNAQKGLGRNLRGGLGKGRAAGRAAFARFDPNAWDGDGDGLVQEGTPFQRPAIPGVNDRATGGKVNARRAIEAYQGGSGFASSSGGGVTRTQEQITNILRDKWGADLIDEADANYIRILNNIGSDEDITALAKRLDIPEDTVRDIIEDYEKARTGQQLSRKKPFADEYIKNRKPKGFASSSSGDPDLPDYGDEDIKLRNDDMLEEFDADDADMPVVIRSLAKKYNMSEKEVREALTDARKRRDRTRTNSENLRKRRAEREERQKLQADIDEMADRQFREDRIDRGFASSSRKNRKPLLSSDSFDAIGRASVDDDSPRIERMTNSELVEEIGGAESFWFAVVRGQFRDDDGDRFLHLVAKKRESIISRMSKDKRAEFEKLTEDMNDDEFVNMLFSSANDDLDEDVVDYFGVAFTEALIEGDFKLPKVVAQDFMDDAVKYALEQEIDNGRAYGFGGFASSSGKPELDSGRAQEVDDIIDQAARAIIGKGSASGVTNPRDGEVYSFMQDEYDKVLSSLKEIFAPLSKEKIKQSPGKSSSELRRNLVEKLSDENFIEQFEKSEHIDDFIDSVADALEESLTARYKEIKKTGTASELKEFEELSSDLESDFRDMSKNLSKRAKDFWAKRRKQQYTDPWWGKGEIPLRPEDAKKDAKFALDDLIDIVERGLQGEAGGYEDFADWLGSLGKSFISSSMKEEIRKGELDTQDLQYELEMVLEHIQELDPSLQPEEITNKLREALKKGGEKNPQLAEIADSWGDDDITGGDLINELRRVQKESKYRPDRGRSEKERLRGFASSSRFDPDGDPDYDEAVGPRERKPGRGMQPDPVGDEVADRLDRDAQNRAVRRGFASSGGKEKLEDDFKQVDMTLEEYGELKKTINNIIKNLEDGDYGADEEIDKLKELTDKIDVSSDANDVIPFEDEEIGNYLGMLEAMRDGGVGLDDVSKEDKDNIDSLIDALKEAQKTGYSESGKLKESGTRLSVAGKSTRSKTRNSKLTSEGTLTPAKKLSITLDDDTISLLAEEADLIADNTKDRQAIESMKKILQDAKGGKFEVTPEQFDSITSAIEDAFENGLITSDIYGVLHQAAESADGKYDINDFVDPPKPKKGFASTNKINNGAPGDITESMQKEFIFWARKQRGLRVAQSIVEDFDKNNGQLKASQWKALRTMYGNMGPGSARGRGFGSRSGGPNISQPTGGGMRDTGGGPLPYVHTTSGWKKVGGAGGLNEASVMQDPKTGKKYYVKHTRSGEELRGESEILTSKLYQLLGIGTINYERGVHNGKLQRVSEWDPSINSSVDHGRMSRDPQFRRSMQGTLIANAWLANWDGTGNMSNIVERDGKAVMADSGGGLMFRAQRYSGMKGQGGTDSFGPKVEEVYNLINGTTRSGQRVQGGVSRAYYNDIEPEEVARQVKELGKVTDDDIRKLVAQTISNPQDGERLAQILIARRDWIVDHWGTGKFVEKPSDTSRSDASSAKARPFASVSRSRGFASSSSIDGPGDDEAGGRTARGARGMGEFVPGGNIAPGRSRGTGVRNKKPGFETKFAGKTFEEMKPDNWDELTLDEKWQWAITYGNPENVENVDERMSQVAYRKLLNDLMDEMDKDDLDAMTPAERRAELRRRAAEQKEIDSMGYMPEGSLEKQPAKKPSAPQEDEDEIVPVKVKKSKNAQDAQTERESRLDGFLEAIEKYRSKFDSDESEVDDHRDVWDKVSDAIQVGGYDFSLQSLDRAIEALDEYIGDFEDGDLSKAERVNISSAKAMRKQLAKARAGYANDEWIPGASKSRGSGFASVGSIPGREIEYTSGYGKGLEKRRKEAETMANAARTVLKDIKKDINKLQGSGKPGTRGFASTSSGGKTMITDEATFFRDVEKSLDKEIRRATKAGDKRAVKGLNKLAEIIRRDEASKTGSRRTNVGSVYFTVDEADEILDGLMFALDTQLEDGGEKRVEWYSRLIEMIAKAAKSTFIDKTTKEITSTTREATNSRGQKKKINIVPEA